MAIGSRDNGMRVDGVSNVLPADAAKETAGKTSGGLRGGAKRPDEAVPSEPQAAGERVIGYERVDALRQQERAALARKIAIGLVVLVALSLASLPVLSYVTSVTSTNDTYIGYIVSPATVLALVQQFLHDSFPFVAAPQQRFDILLSTTGDVHLWTENYAFLAGRQADRIATTLMCIFGGALLGLSGMLYQNVFRNPIATPTMLGVQSGVNLGTLVMVAVFGTAALDMVMARYLVCYGFGVAMLLVVLAGGKLISGKRPFSVVDLLLVGTAVGAISGVLTQYIPAAWDEGTWEVYYTLSEALSTGTSPVAFASVGVVFLLAVVPVFLLRWKLNALSFDNVEVRLLGIDPSRLRMVALVAGSLMILVAMVTVGAVGLMAVIVPFVARYWFGSEARQQFWGNLVLGPVVLVACRLLCDLLEVVFPVLGTSLSMGTVVSVLVLPVFCWVVATHQRGWE